MAKSKHKASDHSADTRAVDGIRGFAGIPRCVLLSEAYRTLSALERAILVEIVERLNGFNNGSIAISYAELAHRLDRKNQAPFAAAIATLWKHGLIEPGQDAFWKERKARTYRLTFVNTTDSIGRPIQATNDYLKGQPEGKNDATDVVAGKAKSATAFVAGKVRTATDAVASGNGKLPKTPGSSATDAVVLISKPYMGADEQGLGEDLLPGDGSGDSIRQPPLPSVSPVRARG